jgi:hypothetical protein
MVKVSVAKGIYPPMLEDLSYRSDIVIQQPTVCFNMICRCGRKSTCPYQGSRVN